MRLLQRFRYSHVESVNDYAGVLVPLVEAHLHSHSARTGRVEFEAREPSPDGDEEDAVKDDNDDESDGMLLMDAAEYTIEGLRKEMRRGKRGQWTEYESKFKSRPPGRRHVLLTSCQSNPSSSTKLSKI